jgi:cob(I)alamin adenosyltransferase
MSKVLTEEERTARHNEKMKKKKAAHDRIVAGKTVEKGLVAVHTGKGKGKSTAAMGMVCRAIGNGMKTGIVQFVKGAWETGEMKVFEAFPDLVEVHVLGEGFTWDTQDREADIAAARRAWDQAKSMIEDPAYRMVLCDELNIVLRYGSGNTPEQTGRHACHHHRQECEGGADGACRSRDGDERNQASLPRRDKGAGRDRILAALRPDPGDGMSQKIDGCGKGRSAAYRQ